LVYLDASALVKLIVEEPESSALRRYLRRRKDRASSAIALVEVVRAARRRDTSVVQHAFALLDETDLLDVTASIVSSAGGIGAPALRSLDAIHLASAQALAEDLEALVTYDVRLAQAATQLGFAVASPA
jgi:predicted nucleic acid-binding protein